MKNYSLPVFGLLNLNSLDQYYEIETEINQNNIIIELSFEGTSIEINKLKEVEKTLINLDAFEKDVKKIIYTNFEKGHEVREYIEHHLNEIDFEFLNLKFDEKDFVNSVEKQMLAKIHLDKISFYPEYEDEHIVLDYTIGKELTDYLLVVKFNENGEFETLVIES